MTPQAVLFDLDGVLLDSRTGDRALHPARPARERRAGARRGRPRALDRATADRRVRASWPGRSGRTRAWPPTASATCTRACSRRPSCRERSTRSPPSPPACRWPSRRASRARSPSRCASASGSPRTCRRSLGPSSTRRRRSRPSPSPRALAALGLEPGAAAPLVGDRRHDVEAAHANGIACVGVLWGIGDEAELRAAGADPIVGEPAELPEALGPLAVTDGRALQSTVVAGSFPSWPARRRWAPSWVSSRWRAPSTGRNDGPRPVRAHLRRARPRRTARRPPSPTSTPAFHRASSSSRPTPAAASSRSRGAARPPPARGS